MRSSGEVLVRATPRSQELVSKWAYAATPAVLSVAGLAIVVSAVLIVFFPWELYPGEAINSFFASSFIHSGTLYGDWTSLTPYFPIYPPGFYWLASPLELLDSSAIWPGRLVSIVGMSAAAWTALRIAIRLGCSRLEAAASGLGFLSIGVTGQLMFAARPDAAAIGLLGGALLATTRWEDERDRSALVTATVLTAAFVVVKYNFAPLGLAIALALGFRDLRAAVTYVAVSALLSLGAFAVADLASSGAFVSNTRDFGIGYALQALTDVLDQTLKPFPNPLLVVAGIEATLTLAARPFRSIRAVHLAWFASLLVIISSLKIGSAANYVAQTAFASSILIGPALMRMRTTVGLRAAGIASVALGLLLAPATYQHVRDAAGRPSQLDELDATYSAAADRLAAAPGPVFGDRNDLTIAAGKGPSLDNVPLALLAENGKWQTGPLIREIRERRLGMIESTSDLFGLVPTIDGTPVWPPEVAAAVRAYYCPTWTSLGSSPATVWLYTPCRNPPTQAPLPSIWGVAYELRFRTGP